MTTNKAQFQTGVSTAEFFGCSDPVQVNESGWRSWVRTSLDF